MIKQSFKIAPVLWAILLMTGAQAWAQGPVKIAVIDARRCIEQTEAGKKMYALFKERSAKDQKELEAKGMALKKLQEDFTKKSEVFSAEVRRDKEKELIRKQEDLQDQAREKNAAFQKEEGEAFQKLTVEIFDSAAALAREQGYTLVFEAKSGVVYFSPAIDITDQVIKKHNAKK
jgi:outer membrane protein